MKNIVAMNYVSAENREEFIRIAKLLVAESQKEAGCLQYDLYEDVSDLGVLTMLEAWKDDAAIDEHNNSSHFKTYVPQLQALCTKPGEVRVYQLL